MTSSSVYCAHQEDLTAGLTKHEIQLDPKHLNTLKGFLNYVPYVFQQAFRAEILMNGWARCAFVCIGSCFSLVLCVSR